MQNKMQQICFAQLTCCWCCSAERLCGTQTEHMHQSWRSSFKMLRTVFCSQSSCLARSEGWSVFIPCCTQLLMGLGCWFSKLLVGNSIEAKVSLVNVHTVLSACCTKQCLLGEMLGKTSQYLLNVCDCFKNQFMNENNMFTLIIIEKQYFSPMFLYKWQNFFLTLKNLLPNVKI